MSEFPRPVDTEDHRTLPVSIDDLKEHVRVEHVEQERLLLTKIMAATDEAERYLNTSIIRRSYTLVLSSFPSASTSGIQLMNAPATAIASIVYYDADGVEQTLAADQYYLLQANAFPTVYLIPDAQWPTTQVRENAVTVTYTAGFAAKQSAVPAAIREAIIIRAASRYDQLPDSPAFYDLLAPFRAMHA